MHEQYAYLSSTDFTRIAADLLPLLDAVLEHSDTLRPEIVKVYRPHPLARRLASTVVRSLPGKIGQRSFGERPISEMLGYRFSDPDHPDIVGVIVEADGHMFIATPYQPMLRQPSELYILHAKLEGYVEVCLACDMVGTATMAAVNVDNARYAIERLLPDGHQMKRPTRKPEDACIDGRTRV